MSYNTRRGTPQNVGNIGSRRPVVTNNFVPGGQLTPQKGGIQQNQQQGYNSQQQTNRPQQQQQVPPQRQSQAVAPERKPVVTPQQQPQQLQQPQPQPAAPQPTKQEPMENGSESKQDGEKKKWVHRKIPKKEKMRRRNMRLSKLLQPKNALMILNELVKNPTFTVIDYVSVEGTQYKANVLVDEIEHSGFGKSKVGAKNAAAETALKYLIKHKKMTQMTQTSEDGTEAMDTTEGEGEDGEGPLPWQQVASFALFKLFSSWGENPTILKDEPSTRELKPAKKLPDNAATLNPLMLVNQMFPYAQFEELPQSGTAPTITFNMKCTVEGQSFTGKGPTKKMAKKHAAFVVCNTLLGIQYPPEVYKPAQ